jgi:hypothetical protein
MLSGNFAAGLLRTSLAAPGMSWSLLPNFGGDGLLMLFVSTLKLSLMGALLAS